MAHNFVIASFRPELSNNEPWPSFSARNISAARIPAIGAWHLIDPALNIGVNVGLDEKSHLGKPSRVHEFVHGRKG